MCKILLWSVENILNHSTANFGRISNSIKISLVGQAPHQPLVAVALLGNCTLDLGGSFEVVLADVTDHSSLTNNSLKLEENGCYFADDIFYIIHMNEKVCIVIRIRLKFVPGGPDDT